MAMSASSAPWPPSSTPPPPLPLPLPSPPPPPSPLPFGGGGGAPGDPSVCGAPPEFACHADRLLVLLRKGPKSTQGVIRSS
ncbi:ena/VASP-like protein isoform X1 [Sorghum bicolor]|uniref:ena/VASP-like protein isoform X1 n=1 Tax=Sorghum bicolor TaxID=4558 RepID=UPI000B425E88|nr:ena/VASP-like protein isoform X1 [Sorghum bicolor]|eukprot:XP_021312276.1 ena/VASP-like protein isoform X1 [Sorghum bicolor]